MKDICKPILLILFMLISTAFAGESSLPKDREYIDTGKLNTTEDFIRVSCNLPTGHQLVTSPEANDEVYLFVKRGNAVYMKDFDRFNSKQHYVLVKIHDCVLV